MLNGAFAFNAGEVLWADAPMPKQHRTAHSLMSACPPKQPLLSFRKTNKRYILPPVASNRWSTCNF
jgi:hypothetical protein